MQAKHTYRLGDHDDPAENSAQAAQAALWRVQHFAAMLQIRQVMLVHGWAWLPSRQAAPLKLDRASHAVQLFRSGIIMGVSSA